MATILNSYSDNRPSLANATPVICLAEVDMPNKMQEAMSEGTECCMVSGPIMFPEIGLAT
jgi:hypothetical protein